MKKITKITLIIGTSLILFGILFMIIGGAMGGVKGVFRFYQDKSWIFNDKEDFFRTNEEHQRDDFTTAIQNKDETIPNKDETIPSTVDYEFSDIKILKMEIDYATIQIKTWNQSGIGVTTQEEGEAFICESEGETLSIRDKSIRIFGNDDPLITVFIPKNYEFKEVGIEIKAASIYIEELIAQNGKFDIGAGYMEGYYIQILNEMFINMGAGSMDLESFDGKFLNVECGVGEVDIEGILRGDSQIKADVGSVSLDLRGREQDYNYNIKSGLGEISVEESYYRGISEQRKIDNGAAIIIQLECNLGEIELDFENGND